jgi:arylsulfatase
LCFTLLLFIGCINNKSTQPNIIIIFTDDQGYADLGSYGAIGFETPNIDKLAKEGIRFTDFQVSQAVCSASRAALLTGAYSERVSVRGAYNHTSRIGLNPNETTIAEILKPLGYATSIVGKWHLGHHEMFLPLQQGFDEYMGIPYSNDMWPVDYDGTPIANTDHPLSFYPQLPFYEGNNKVEEIQTLSDQNELTKRYTKRAVDFINRNKNNPFFLYLPHSMPHVPLGVSSEFKGKSKQGMYGDVMMEIDWSVGQIMKALSENGIDENTLVIFTSDNGPWLNYGNHAGSVGNLREGKGTMWEGGSRVPCIMRWPKKIPKGHVSNQLAATIDILPTIAAVTGAKLPDYPIDGINIESIIYGDSINNPRNEYYYYYSGDLIAVRRGKMKLVFPHTYRSYEGYAPGSDGYPAIYEGVLGRYASGKSELSLYDLNIDRSEEKNIISQHPEIVKELQLLGNKARLSFGDKLKGVKGEEVRPIGQLDIDRPKSELKSNHLGVGKSIQLKKSYSIKYSGNGNNTVINGMLGTLDHNDGNWQGYEENDFEAVIDLGELVSINQISCSFLKRQSSWIFSPSEVNISMSKDGISFVLVKNFSNATKENPAYEIKTFLQNFEKFKTRYIKVNAKNLKVCPDWHPGKGGKAWLFIDEIVIK